MKLEIEFEEYELIRNAMVKRPFEEIAQLIVKCDNQIIEQQKKEQEKSKGQQ